MSATKNPSTKTWTCQFYYTDHTGIRRKKFKRGFTTKKAALKWQQEFLITAEHSPMMPFSAFAELYIQDMQNRLRASTMVGKTQIIQNKIIPWFGTTPLSSIRPSDVRQWENQLLSYTKKNNKKYAATYLKTIYNQLNAIFNYAEKYYDLRENPCRKAESIGSSQAGRIDFWTFAEFQEFFSHLDPSELTTLAFQVLYFSGIRVGELLALTYEDIDWTRHSLNITKSCQRSRKGDVITPPKTQKGIRSVTLPLFLMELLKAQFCPGGKAPEPDLVLFPFQKYYLTKVMAHTCKDYSLKRIRLHDLRHSHASLLIELGYSPLLIAERLGHEKVETTLSIYSHLYPGKQQELAKKLNALVTPKKSKNSKKS